MGLFGGDEAKVTEIKCPECKKANLREHRDGLTYITFCPLCHYKNTKDISGCFIATACYGLESDKVKVFQI